MNTALEFEVTAHLQQLQTARKLRDLSTVEIKRGRLELADRMLKRAAEIALREKNKGWLLN